MNLKITLTIDPERGEQLIGLLAKALGREEAGVGDMRIELIREATPVHKSSWVQKVVERSQLPKPAKIKRKGYALGMRAFKSGKPNGVVITLSGLAMDATRDGLQTLWGMAGLSKNGLSATLSKLKARGYVVMLDNGAWRLSPKGKELVDRWQAEHPS